MVEAEKISEGWVGGTVKKVLIELFWKPQHVSENTVGDRGGGYKNSFRIQTQSLSCLWNRIRERDKERKEDDKTRKHTKNKYKNL